jgi:hypothetical protein
MVLRCSKIDICLLVISIGTILFFPLQWTDSFAQELEPRALTNVPVGLNFAVLGYGYARGNILLDPAVPIENLDSRLSGRKIRLRQGTGGC